MLYLIKSGTYFKIEYIYNIKKLDKDGHKFLIG